MYRNQSIYQICQADLRQLKQLNQQLYNLLQQVGQEKDRFKKQAQFFGQALKRQKDKIEQQQNQPSEADSVDYITYNTLFQLDEYLNGDDGQILHAQLVKYDNFN